MKVILISGKARAGKDTSANIMKDILESFDKRVLITHFADLLKYICRSYLNWDGKKDEGGRSLLQYIGTDVIRKKSPDFWVDFIIQILGFFEDMWDFVIIPDCRFPNEASKIKESGFNAVCIRIDRAENPETLTAEQQNHISELSVDDIKPDFYIQNDGSVGDLVAKINEFIKENIL